MNRRRIVQPLFSGLLLALAFGIVWALAVTFATMSISEVMCAKDELKIVGEFPDVGRSDGACLELPGPTRSSGFGGMIWPGRILSFKDVGIWPPTYWYLMHDGRRKGTAYFVGYDSETKLPIGHIGINAFQEELPEWKERFPMAAEMMHIERGIIGRSHLWQEPRESHNLFGVTSSLFADSKVCLISENRLLVVDLHARSVRVLLDADGLCAITRVHRDRADYMAVRTADQVLMLDSEGGRQQSFVIPAELRNRPFTFYDLGVDSAMFEVTQARERSATFGNRFVWSDRQGNVIREQSVTFEDTSWLGRVDVMVGVAGVAVPATGFFTTAVVWPSVLVDEGTSTSYSAATAKLLPICWPTLLAVNLLGVGLAIVCYRRQKRFGQVWVWPWVVFVFLFGLPGMVGYLAHQRWPVREGCPKCKEQVPRDRDACAACDEPFPKPELKGIEVLV